MNEIENNEVMMTEANDELNSTEMVESTEANRNGGKTVLLLGVGAALGIAAKKFVYDPVSKKVKTAIAKKIATRKAAKQAKADVEIPVDTDED